MRASEPNKIAKNDEPQVQASVEACREASCRRCRSDQAFLRRAKRPQAAKGVAVRAADLFAGCGGMSVGLQEAVRRAGRGLVVPLAMDADQSVINIYKLNLPGATTVTGDVAAAFDGALGASLTQTERKTKRTVGSIDVLLGGPPCQGHSNLNNHTRGNDPKNLLYLRMARAAEVLRPKVVVIENVPAVLRDETRVVETSSRALRECGYDVASGVVDLRRVGVPQRRRRHLLIAAKLRGFDAARVLASLNAAIPEHPDRGVAWAIQDLANTSSKSVYDTPSRASADSVRRMRLLFERDLYDLPNDERPECHHDDHSYVSMYGRLRWHQPAQTITTGFGSMGQGRYVHPERHRTITPHEAARLQTFPDWYSFGEDSSRAVLARAIGNAVPPLLMVELGRAIIPKLRPRPRNKRS